MAVGFLGSVLGGGYSELWTKDVLFWGALAGLVGFTIPTIITDVAARRVVASASGMLYMFDTPIANVVGSAGAALGWLGAEQAPDVWGWTGMALVATAVGFSSMLPPPETLLRLRSQRR